jgi:hypothetical protein
MVNYEILSQPLFLLIAIRCQYYKTCSWDPDAIACLTSNVQPNFCRKNGQNCCWNFWKFLDQPTKPNLAKSAKPIECMKIHTRIWNCGIYIVLSAYEFATELLPGYKSLYPRTYKILHLSCY